SQIGNLASAPLVDAQSLLCIYADKQGFTQAHLASKNGAMHFISLFEDGYCQTSSTDYKPQSLSRGDATHIRKAYIKHQRAVDAIGDEHGDLQLFDSLQDYLDWEREFRVSQYLEDLNKKACGCG